MVARPCMLDVMWERNGDCVILSRRFNSRIRTLEREWVLCQSGRLATLASSSALEDINTSCLPGDNVQNWKEDEEGPHCHEEPWENPCDHSNTEEHQDDILDEHLGLERQAHIDWGNRKGTSVRLLGSANREDGTKSLRKQKEVPLNAYLKFVCCLLNSLIKEKSRNLVALIFLFPRKFILSSLCPLFGSLCCPTPLNNFQPLQVIYACCRIYLGTKYAKKKINNLYSYQYPWTPPNI